MNASLATDSVEVSLLESVRRLAAQARLSARQSDEDAHYDEGLWNRVKELGLAGLCVPEAQGGAQVSISLFCKVCETLATTDTTTSTLVHLQGNNAYLLRHAPNRATADMVLAEMAEGKTLTAYALTEPAAGSDAAHIQAT